MYKTRALGPRVPRERVRFFVCLRVAGFFTRLLCCASARDGCYVLNVHALHTHTHAYTFHVGNDYVYIVGIVKYAFEIRK